MALASNDQIVAEETSPKFTATLKDESDTALNLSQIGTATLTLYDVSSGTVINGRNRQDIKDANNVDIATTGGLITWTTKAADHIIVGSPAVGVLENHVAHFEWTWGWSSTATLGTDPFATSAGSAVVTVTDTSHGLADKDSVAFSGVTDFDNVHIQGHYIITYVDANSYTITVSTNATAGIAGGGASVTIYRGVKVGREDQGLKVKQFTKVPV